MDLHHNIFYSYRGAIIDADDRERQLENNLTKALVNTLALGGDDVCRAFFAEIGIADAQDAKFLLQRRDLPIRSARDRQKRVLLGISKCESKCVFSPGVDKGYDSVPDAWMYGDGFAVLVESKANGDFSPEQMQAHLEYLRNDGYPAPRVVLRTWRELHSTFGRLLPRLSGIPKFLVEQFIQFLEYSSMSGFTGFQIEHFRYFLLHDDETQGAGFASRSSRLPSSCLPTSRGRSHSTNSSRSVTLQRRNRSAGSPSVRASIKR